MQTVKLKGHEQQETEGTLHNRLQRRHAHDSIRQTRELTYRTGHVNTLCIFEVQNLRAGMWGTLLYFI